MIRPSEKYGKKTLAIVGIIQSPTAGARRIFFSEVVGGRGVARKNYLFEAAYFAKGSVTPDSARQSLVDSAFPGGAWERVGSEAAEPGNE
jgi:hypothetical protein